jgi:hypothetical protein
MSDRFLRRQVNEYLAAEWGHEGEIDDGHPFLLTHLGSLEGSEVFEFADGGERFFAFAGPWVGYVRAGVMSLEDLRVQEAGSAWLGRREPIDLGTSRIGDERVPPAIERRAAIQALIGEVGLDPDTTTILEGFFLVDERRYVALVEASDGDRFAILDARAVPVAAVMRGVANWQQLAHAVGSQLS